MSTYIDIHSHLDHPIPSKDIDGIILRAKKAGVGIIITNGITPQTNQLCLSLSKKYDIVKCAMGLYPKEALQNEIESMDPSSSFSFSDYDSDSEIASIRKHAKEIVAISEVGLDFVNGDSRQQREDFQKMISLAQELNKPIIVHSRKAEEACVTMLEASSYKKIIMHCFCGNKKLVKRIIDNGWNFSIPTSVVRAEQFGHIARDAPLSQLFCETDTPYLGPIKGEWNEPSNVVESYKKIAQIKGMELIEVRENIYFNYQRLFL